MIELGAIVISGGMVEWKAALGTLGVIGSILYPDWDGPCEDVYVVSTSKCILKI